VATIDFAANCGFRTVRSRELDGTDFATPGRFARHSFTLDIEEGMDDVVFRVSSTGRIALSLDCIDLARLSAAEDEVPPGGWRGFPGTRGRRHDLK
jgi:hypothetical protein